MTVAASRWFPSLLFVVAGCAHIQPTPSAGASVTVTTDDALPQNWKAIVLPADATRLAAMEESWKSALQAARTGGFTKAVDAEGPLLEAASALPRPAPPPGRYRCRTIKLGTGTGGGTRRIAFARYKPFFCYVEAEGALLTLTKGSGSQRPGGRLWEDGDSRMIFLGAIAEGRGSVPPYGADPKRDRVGAVERIGEFRWRLVMPGPPPQRWLDIVELVPDTPPPTEPAQ